MKLVTSLAVIVGLCSQTLSTAFSPQKQLFRTHHVAAIIPPTKTSWALYEDELKSLTFNASNKNKKCGVLHSSASSAEETSGSVNLSEEEETRNKAYINGLLQNLSAALDRWIVTGSMATRTRAYNIMKQIERESKDEGLVQQSIRMASRASMPLTEPPPPKQKPTTPKPTFTNKTEAAQRKREAEERKEWEESRRIEEENSSTSSENSSDTPTNFQRGVRITTGKKKSTPGRSALSNRAANNSKPDIFMGGVMGDNNNDIDDKVSELNPMEFAESKKGLEDELAKVMPENKNKIPAPSPPPPPPSRPPSTREMVQEAEAKTSELVAQAGSGSAFSGKTLGIGGLDDVLSQVKRRIWVPLAAPPTLLAELGINPVRGLLLYGLPGCGKTLLARSLGKILSPARPITVVSGPEIMDRFVGSSEANLREIFDNPPDIYDTYRIGTRDNGAAVAQAALHVIILDEFDAMARARGGSGKGDQGDAGVARDSVVNQLLAKMDGVDSLVVPTLVIGLTNKRSLIEPALLRPGRFEVQIEVPKPKTVAQRVSILNVHMKNMYESGRLYVSDAPLNGSAASRRLSKLNGETDDLLSYDELLDFIAVECDGMSGASLAGVARAAASHALERAVYDFAGSMDESNSNASSEEGSSVADCMVTKEDIDSAIQDVLESSGSSDGGEEEDTKTEEKK